MKKIITRLLVASLTFTLGASAALLWLEWKRPAVEKLPQPHYTWDAYEDDYFQMPEMPILSYCELARDPVRFDERLVRVSGRMVTTAHGLVLQGPNCDRADEHAALFFHPYFADDAARRIEQATGTESPYISADLVAVGVFRVVAPTYASDSVYDTSPLHFEIRRVERAAKPR